MDTTTLSLALTVVATSVLSAALVLALWFRFVPSRRVNLHRGGLPEEEAAFLFDDEQLIDATPEGHRLLAQGPPGLEDGSRLAAVLDASFPDLRDRIATLGDVLTLEIPSADGALSLTAEWLDGLTRIAISRADVPTPDMRLEPDIAATTLADQLAETRAILDAASFPVWREDVGGAVRWANNAYIDLALQKDPEASTLGWPLPRLFELAEEAQGTDMHRRHSVSLPARPGDAESRTLWFDVEERATEPLVTYYALPADGLVEAEENRKAFTQTLAKTFAHLPTGLAVFDKNRRLALFNPALTDLSNLPPLFLSRRPTLFEFLDQLREVRRMPEPKDYRDWRRRIGQLEVASSNGTHIETWNLPDGQVFRVTGRPHPDGAVAFLFQDITSEVTLTRRFRSELEMGQAVVDSFDEAICVFSPSCALVLSNAAYRALWEHGNAPSLAPATLATALESWKAGCAPSPAWGRIDSFATETGKRDAWTTDLHLRDGRALLCRVVPLTGNATLVGFRLRVADRPRLALRPAASDGLAADATLSGAARPRPEDGGEAVARADAGGTAGAPTGGVVAGPTPSEKIGERGPQKREAR